MGIFDDSLMGKIEHQHIAALEIPVNAEPRERIGPCVAGVWSALCHVAALVDTFRLMADNEPVIWWAERGEVAVCAYVELQYVHEQLLAIEQGLEEKE